MITAALVAGCDAGSTDDATTTLPPASEGNLGNLAAQVCEDLGKGLVSWAIVIEDAIVQAGEISFSRHDLGLALIERCPHLIPATEVLGTDELPFPIPPEPLPVDDGP